MKYSEFEDWEELDEITEDEYIPFWELPEDEVPLEEWDDLDDIGDYDKIEE
jgi:hypothetical protein